MPKKSSGNVKRASGPTHATTDSAPAGSLVVQLPHGGWKPRHYQEHLWHRMMHGTAKRGVAVWHRRAGKDELCLHLAACKAMLRVGNYWHMLPKANQARRAIWEAVNPHTGRRRIDEAFPEIIRESTRDQDMMIRFVNGSTWQVFGSDNYESGVGSPPIGVVFSEYAQADPNAWAFLRPILAENGGWALFIGTPRGRNHLARLYEASLEDQETWCSSFLTVEDTGAIPMEVIDRERRELRRERGEKEADAIIDQEYYCSFDAAIPGAYYGSMMSDALKEGRIVPLRYDPAHPVVTAWDLGIGDSTVIWFVQPVGRELRVVNYIEGSGVALDWYAKRIHALPYTYAEHIGPWDADSRELIAGKSRTAALRELGIRMRVLPKTGLDAGIQAVRRLLPKCVFSTTPEALPWEKPDDARERMSRGLDGLRQYQREWDDRLQKFKDAPLHDWASHPADGFRTLAMGVKERYDSPRRDHFGHNDGRTRYAESDYSVFGESYG